MADIGIIDGRSSGEARQFAEQSKGNGQICDAGWHGMAWTIRLTLGAMRAETGKMSSQSGISLGAFDGASAHEPTRGTIFTTAGLAPSFVTPRMHSLFSICAEQANVTSA